MANLPYVIIFSVLALVIGVGLGWLLPTLLTYILIALCSLFLICLVLIQRGRGGGLAGAFGGVGGSSAFGTRAGDVFTWITVVTASAWISLNMGLVMKLNQPGQQQSELAPDKQAAQEGGVREGGTIGGSESPSAQPGTDSPGTGTGLPGAGDSIPLPPAGGESGAGSSDLPPPPTSESDAGAETPSSKSDGS